MSTRTGKGRWPLPKGWMIQVDVMTCYSHASGALVWRGPMEHRWFYSRPRTAKPWEFIARTRAEAFRKAVGR